ncbi:MAG: HvfC/BufC family peptide modification chaperone [Bacteriovorax sp.]
MKQKEFNQKFAEVVRSQKSDRDLTAMIKDSPRLKAARALEVYQEDYQARMTEALQNTYRAISALIGDEDFFRLSSDYIKAHPSPYSDLDDYGNHLSEFLAAHPLNEDYIFLSELAHHEWTFRTVFHLPCEPGADALSLHGLLQGDSSKVQLVNSARLLHYSFLIDELYALKDATDDEGEQDFDFEHEQFLLMFKSDVMVKVYVLSKNQWEFMKNFQTPHSFSEIFQKAPATMTPEEMKSLFEILGSERLILKL